MPKRAETIQPAVAWMDALRFKRPELFAHGKNYAVECAIAEACGLPHPLPPGIRIQRGAENRGKAISKAARSNARRPRPQRHKPA